MAQQKTDIIFGGDHVDAKVELMRRRAAARVQKMLDARERTIGIDKEALAAQCEEKAEAKRDEENETAAYAEYEARIRDVVYARELAERAEAAALNATIKSEWGDHAAHRAEEERIAAITRPVKPDGCGMSAAQKFDGEDADFGERSGQQGKMVQSWLVQQMEEKRQRKDEEDDEFARYAQYEAFVAAQRGDMERDESQRRAQHRAAVAAANRSDAAARRNADAADRAKIAALERGEVRARLTDPDLIETTSTAKSRLGDHRYRPDHFKGLATEQVRGIIASNEKIIAANTAKRQDEADATEDYDNSQAELLRLAHDDEDQYQSRVKQNAIDLADELLAMRDVERNRIRQSKEDRFGYIRAGYLDGFGKSCR